MSKMKDVFTKLCEVDSNHKMWHQVGIKNKDGKLEAWCRDCESTIFVEVESCP